MVNDPSSIFPANLFGMLMRLIIGIVINNIAEVVKKPRRDSLTN